MAPALASPKHDRFSTPAAVQRAASCAWDNRFEEAFGLLDGKKNTDARYALEWGWAELVRNMVMGSASTDNSKLLNHFHRAEKLARAMQKRANDNESKDKSLLRKVASFIAGPPLPADPHALGIRLQADAIYADALLITALSQLNANQPITGFLNLRKCWGCYRDLLEAIETRGSDVPPSIVESIRFGTGVFYVFLSLLPEKLIKALTLIGFVADRKLGKQYLIEVQRGGGVRSGLASLVLLTFTLFVPQGFDAEADTRLAREVLDATTQRYPHNTYFYAYEAFYWRRQGNSDSALRSIQLSEKNLGNDGTLLLRLIHADTLFMGLRWADAAALYRSVWKATQTKEGRDFGFSGQVVLTLAACHVMLGDISEARKVMGKVASATNKNSKQDSASPDFAELCATDETYYALAPVFCLYLNKDLDSLSPSSLNTIRGYLEDSTASSTRRHKPGSYEMLRLFKGIVLSSAGDFSGARKELQAVIAAESRYTAKRDPCGVLAAAYFEMAFLEHKSGTPRSKALSLLSHGVKLHKASTISEALDGRFRAALSFLQG